jgi:hypothetical protein
VKSPSTVSATLVGNLRIKYRSRVRLPRFGGRRTPKSRALDQFLAIGLPITMNVRNVYTSGDIALVIADWSLKGTGADGSDVDMSGRTADVARRGTDGWKFVIDNPFGTS